MKGTLAELYVAVMLGVGPKPRETRAMLKWGTFIGRQQWAIASHKPADSQSMSSSRSWGG
ncbi:msl9656 (plasmid) [Mesorhizobium japonicum MAFF 303099]|uniref:Msl9656 protein n=1 Tax=Mesorhizobium japonicum (strain LMG 29417 / CECT 9101 / MAFF 303099) TaxID=266835 RepID=Q98P09_RHILO|nr:msl9656 [Mesorhizobium japonicum MAFF 303099]